MKSKNKHKIISIILSLSITVSMFTAFNLSVEAGSSDVTGLDSGVEYYIKNTGSGKYLDVDHGIAENNRNVLEYSFNGGTNQKWKIVRLSNGQYKILSSLNNDYGLDITSTGNAIIYKYKGSSNEKFDLSRTGGGTYNIKNNGKYVTVSNGNVQTSVSYPSGTWSFERVYKGNINMFSYIYPDGLNTTIHNNYITTYLNNMNYNSVTSSVNANKNNALNKLKTSQIWIFQGHGSGGNLITTSGGNIDIVDIALLDPNALSNERVVVASACHSGDTQGTRPTGSGNNLVEAMYAKGAHFVIGWEGIINNSNAAIWCRFFSNKASIGLNVYDCVYYANIHSILYTDYYVGDTFQILTR